MQAEVNPSRVRELPVSVIVFVRGHAYALTGDVADQVRRLATKYRAAHKKKSKWPRSRSVVAEVKKRQCLSKGNHA